MPLPQDARIPSNAAIDRMLYRWLLYQIVARGSRAVGGLVELASQGVPGVLAKAADLIARSRASQTATRPALLVTAGLPGDPEFSTGLLQEDLGEGLGMRNRVRDAIARRIASGGLSALAGAGAGTVVFGTFEISAQTQELVHAFQDVGTARQRQREQQRAIALLEEMRARGFVLQSGTPFSGSFVLSDQAQAARVAELREAQAARTAELAAQAQAQAQAEQRERNRIEASLSIGRTPQDLFRIAQTKEREAARSRADRAREQQLFIVPLNLNPTPPQFIPTLAFETRDP